VHQSLKKKIINYQIDNVYGYDIEKFFESITDVIKTLIKDYWRKSGTPKNGSVIKCIYVRQTIE